MCYTHVLLPLKWALVWRGEAPRWGDRASWETVLPTWGWCTQDLEGGKGGRGEERGRGEEIKREGERKERRGRRERKERRGRREGKEGEKGGRERRERKVGEEGGTGRRGEEGGKKRTFLSQSLTFLENSRDNFTQAFRFTLVIQGGSTGAGCPPLLSRRTNVQLCPGRRHKVMGWGG